MKLARGSLERCRDLAFSMEAALSIANGGWSDNPSVCGLWPPDYSEEMRLPWLGAILPAFVRYYLRQNGVGGEGLEVATETFTKLTSYAFGRDGKERNEVLRRSVEFGAYFEPTCQEGARELGIISLPAFLAKKQGASEEKIFACSLLYAYTLGAYWMLKSVGSENAVSSARPLALAVECDKIAATWKSLFDDFANCVELDEGEFKIDMDAERLELDDDEESAVDDEDEEGEEVDFFDDRRKFDESDPEDNEGISCSRAHYSRELENSEELEEDASFETVDAGLRIANDIYTYILHYRIQDKKNPLDLSHDDSRMIDIGVVIIFALEFINGMCFRSCLSDVISIAKRSLMYRLDPRGQERFLITNRMFAKFFGRTVEDGDEFLGVPPIKPYIEAQIDLEKLNEEACLKEAINCVLRYSFNMACVWHANYLNTHGHNTHRDFTPEEQFAMLFDSISVSELTRIIFDACTRNAR